MTLRSVICLGALCAAGAWGQPPRPIKINPKEKKEPLTQVLPVPQEPPSALAVETAKLSFHVSPLSNKGLLSQQIRDALKAIDKVNGNATLVRLRAFIAGNGDMRRVQAIVSEDFSERRIALPVITTMQVGALPMDGAQVILEATSLERRAMNPHGLAFLAAQRAADAPGALAKLKEAAAAHGVKPEDMLRVTCFLSSIEDASLARKAIADAFPAALTNVMQLTRLGIERMAACEGSGRLNAAPAAPVQVRNDGLTMNAPKLVLSGARLAFRDQDSDLKLALERVRKDIEAAGGTPPLFASLYSLNREVRDRMEAMAPAILGATPALTSIVVEGLPALSAPAAIDLITAAK